MLINIPDSLTFSDYFKLNYYPRDILRHFGYSFRSEELTLPKSTMVLDDLENLQKRLKKSLPLITFDNETARREFLIAPVLMDLIDYTQAELRVLYPLNASSQLRGELDYFIESHNQLLVIEAKDENLERGFKQLAVELIAVEQMLEDNRQYIYGAVSIGKVWQLAILDRHKKEILQDLMLYRVPTDLDDLMRILVAILMREE
ncbi:Type I restriction enzyme R protein N-terminal domain-containing protein [Tumidithrix helvetica PCC 7403]|uniref:hypothetical protein n=1 Tax=Tumidithrix helvetica TaxID=3457545 RepID=UPI003CB3C209